VHVSCKGPVSVVDSEYTTQKSWVGRGGIVEAIQAAYVHRQAGYHSLREEKSIGFSFCSLDNVTNKSNGPLTKVPNSLTL